MSRIKNAEHLEILNHNKSILLQWAELMTAQHEGICFAISVNEHAQLNAYTTLTSREEVVKYLENILFTLKNSREIIKL